MSEKIKDGGPAFPIQDASTWQGHGMTLRDYFAAKAMQVVDGSLKASDFAKQCYRVADEMLAAREAKS